MDDNKVNVLLNEKLDQYRKNLDDFIAPNEITVTITLSEYRRLVERDATTEERIRKADNERRDYSIENERLRNKISELTQANERLNERIAELKQEHKNIKVESEGVE